MRHYSDSGSPAWRHFYQSRFGRRVQKRVNEHLKFIWKPALLSKPLLGVGCTPMYLADAPHSCHLILPEYESVLSSVGNRRMFVSEALYWPIRNQCMEGVFFIHGLDGRHESKDLLKEAWRVLKYRGRVCVVVPNSASLWRAWPEHLSAGGLFKKKDTSSILHALQANLFTPVSISSIMLFPPVLGPLTDGLNWVAEGVLPYFGSLVFIDAVKILKPKKGLFSKQSLRLPLELRGAGAASL